MPAQIRGNYGIDGVIDQELYRLPGGDPGKGVSAFARVFAGPQEQNQIGFYADGGLVFSGFVPGRGDDTFGVGLAYSTVSDRAVDFDKDALAFGTGAFVRNYEAVVEVNTGANCLGLDAAADVPIHLAPRRQYRKSQQARSCDRRCGCLRSQNQHQLLTLAPLNAS